MRASITSSTPSLKVAHGRGKPGFVGLVATMDTPGSSPNSSASTVAIALLAVEWPDRYSGCGGVGKQRGPGRVAAVHVAVRVAVPDRRSAAARSCRRTWRPSRRCGVGGRDVDSASTRAASERSRPRASITWRAAPFQIAAGGPSQNGRSRSARRSASVLVRDPISLTSL